MQKFHVITGLPRSGSTLLCNILNQNPKFWASSTSVIPPLLNGISNFLGQNLDYKSLLEKDKEKTLKRTEESQRSLIKAWYSREDGREVIFDKSRGWMHNSLHLGQLFPAAKLIVCIRDLRNVFASMEKQHQKNPILNIDGANLDRLLTDRYIRAFSPQGIIGGPLLGLQDVLRRKAGPDIVLVPYEALVADPGITIQNIYTKLREPLFEHDFENVENTSTDPDGHYLHKYPHKGEGKVTSGDPEEWKKYLPDDIVSDIMQKFSWYNQKFSYGQKG